MEGERRPFVKNLRIKDGMILDEETYQKGILDQHWLLEIVAQAGGLVALSKVRDDIAPVLIEAGATRFRNIPIFAGDRLTSYLTIQMADEQQILLNAQVQRGKELVAEIKDLLLQFIPMSQIKQAIERARR